MRPLLTLSLVLGLLVAPAAAQRAVPARRTGGFSAPRGFVPPRMSGGFGSGSHFSRAPMMPERNFSAPQYRWNMAGRSLYMPNRSRYSPPPPDWRRGHRHYYRNRYRQPYIPYFYANSTYLVPGLLNSYWDYPDMWDSDDQTSQTNQTQAENNSDNYAQPEPAPYQPQQAQDVPPPPPAPFDPTPQAAITLVYKDGHSQQIHNYAMTKTTLYVLDDAASGRRPQIALDQIDLPATEKANRESGVDFVAPIGAD